MKWTAWLFFIALPSMALTTAYVSFDQPSGWDCELSTGVWICQSNLETDRKESVVFSIAAVATEFDTLDNHIEFLNKPRLIKTEDGKKLQSKITYVRKRNINGQDWVDSLQFNSELPGFWARYLSTVHQTSEGKLAILITYIVSEKRYSKLAPQFEKMIATLKPVKDAIVPTQQSSGPLPGSEELGNLLKERLNTEPEPATPEEPPTAPGTQNNIPLILAVLIVAILYLYVRKKKR